MKNNKILFLIFCGILLRIVLSLSGMHSDIVFINYFPGKFAYNGVLNIYQLITDNYPASRAWSYYPPLTYFIIGIFQFIFRPLAWGYQAWLEHMHTTGIANVVINEGTNMSFFWNLLRMKSIYLIFDAISLFALLKVFKDRSGKVRALKLWVFNPVILYGTYLIGQIDILPTTFIILSMLFIFNRKIRLGFLFLGLSALCKTFALFLFIPVLIIESKHAKEFLKNIFWFILPFMVFAVPLYLVSGSEVIRSFFPLFYSSGGSSSFMGFLPKIIFLFLYIVFTFRIFAYKEEYKRDKIYLIYLSYILLLYTLFFVPIHYFIWVTPFMIIAVLNDIISFRLYMVQMLLLFIYALNGDTTTTHLFLPLNPDYFVKLPGLPDIMHKLGIRWGIVMLISRLTFLTICTYISVRMFGFFQKDSKPEWIKE